MLTGGALAGGVAAGLLLRMAETFSLDVMDKLLDKVSWGGTLERPQSAC